MPMNGSSPVIHPAGKVQVDGSEKLRQTVMATDGSVQNIRMSDPVQNTLAHLDGVKQTADDQWQARCPAHDDQHASLCVGRGADGRVLIHCQAGCSTFEIRRVLNLPWSAFFPPGESGAVGRGAANRSNSASAGRGGSRIIATYDYRDAAGTLLYQVVRFDPKDFRVRRPAAEGRPATDGRPGPDGGWVWELGDVPRVLYRLPELTSADPTAWVYIAEGEKDVDSLAGQGLVATCNPGGAGKWAKLADDSALTGRKVCILPDKDEAGRRHVQDVAGCVARLSNFAFLRSLALARMPLTGSPLAARRRSC